LCVSRHQAHPCEAQEEQFAIDEQLAVVLGQLSVDVIEHCCVQLGDGIELVRRQVIVAEHHSHPPISAHVKQSLLEEQISTVKRNELSTIYIFTHKIININIHGELFRWIWIWQILIVISVTLFK
jgi:hypothetical protein